MTQPPPPLQQQQQSSPFGLHGVEDLNFSANDQGDLVLISDDDEYAQELQLQEFLMSSFITSQNTIEGSSSSSSKAVRFTLVPITKQVDYVDGDKEEEKEPGESSFSSHVICEICAETRECDQMFRNKGCDHSFCSDCVTKQVATKVEEGITVVGCPGLNCKGVLELDACRPILAQELQFQEFLMSSFITSQNTIEGSSSSSSKAVGFTLVPITKRVDYVDGDKEEEKEPGESSFSSHVICEICAETRECDQMFRNKGCDHSFCSDCVTKQVATKVEEGITVVGCPGLNCKGVLELDACRPILPKELLDKWDKALCEDLFLAAPKLYCPFRDCSAMLLLNDDEGENIGEAECPSCHRLFCARCYVPWHPGVECQVFQSLNEDERGREDLLVRELAGEKKWKRCPRCKFYVEKTQGCLHILCRCRFEFCYACGEQWTPNHGGCQRN